MHPWDVICHRWRTWCRMTQQEAADALGVPVGTWGRWERGEYTPPVWRQEQLLDAMIVEIVAIDGALAGARERLKNGSTD